MFDALVAHMNEALTIRRAEPYDTGSERARMAVADQLMTDRVRALPAATAWKSCRPAGRVDPTVGLLAAVRRPLPLHLERARPVEHRRLRAVLRALRVTWCASSHRLTMPGRITPCTAWTCRPATSGGDALTDFPGDIIRLHRDAGFDYIARYHVWKEPLAVRNRTMKKDLAHRTSMEDSTRCSVASADYLLCFRKRGENPVPVTHPDGLTEYAGERPIPHEL